MTIQISKSTVAPAPTQLAKSGPPIVQAQHPKPKVTKSGSFITLTEQDGSGAFATYSFGANDTIEAVVAIINTDRVQAGLAPINVDFIGR